MRQNETTAFVIPCLNEELTIAQVIRDCRMHLPQASVYVFDNNSTDKTAEVARAEGATVIASPKPGKGSVIQHAFQILDADHLVILDGDATYPVHKAPEMVSLLNSKRYDMVVCTREAANNKKAFPKFHKLGNRGFSMLVSGLLGNSVSDVFSGYRAVSRDFYESLTLESRGFEIESELTIKAYSHGFSVKEVQGPYHERPEGSHSKLKTFSDGSRILKFVFLVMRDCRPLFFFGWIAILCFLLSLAAGWAPIQYYIHFFFFYTVPRAVLSASLMILSIVSFGVGLILDSQLRHLRDQSKLMRRWLKRRT